MIAAICATSCRVCDGDVARIIPAAAGGVSSGNGASVDGGNVNA